MRLAPLSLCLAAACTASMPPAEPEEFVLSVAEPEAVNRPAAPTELAISPLPATPPTPLQIVSSAPGRRIGDTSRGAVAWFSRNARFAAIGIADPNGPQCHGAGPRGRHTLHDLDTGRSERLDWLAARDPRGRYLVFHADARLWLLDSDTGVRTELAGRGASNLDPGDPCASNRRAAFDAIGRHLTYLRGPRSHEQVIWHDLANATELTITLPAAARPVWRAEPSITPGWLRVFTVLHDTDEHGRRTPLRRRGYATSELLVSHTLTVGDAPAIVGAGGRQDLGVTPLGADLFAALQVANRPLTASHGLAPAIPPSCRGAAGHDGLAMVVLHCNPEDRLWWPRSHQSLELTSGGLLDTATHLAADGQLWLAARVRLEPRETHILRVNASTPSVFAGPRILLDVHDADEQPLQADRAGWLYFNNPAGLLALELDTGRTRIHLGTFARKLRPGAAELQGRWFALDPANARMHLLPGTPTAVADNGCALVSSNTDPELRATHGPWTLHCPQP